MGISAERAKKYRTTNEDRKGGGGFASELKAVITPGDNVVRLVGTPKDCMRAWISCDDGKTRPFVLQTSSTLWQLYEHVMTSEGTGQNRVYAFKDTDAYVTLTGGGNYKKAWKPRWTYVMNCIPRFDSTDDEGRSFNVSEENEHLALLAQADADIGVGPLLFEAILDVAENDGDTDLYDVNITKKGKEKDTTYGCMRASRRNGDYGHLVKTREQLTAAEKSWEPYDLSALVNPSRAAYVVKHLAVHIQAVDHELKTGYLGDLQEQAEAEEGNGAQPTKRRTARATKAKSTRAKSTAARGAK